MGRTGTVCALRLATWARAKSCRASSLCHTAQMTLTSSMRALWEQIRRPERGAPDHVLVNDDLASGAGRGAVIVKILARLGEGESKAFTGCQLFVEQALEELRGAVRL